MEKFILYQICGRKSKQKILLNDSAIVIFPVYMRYFISPGVAVYIDSSDIKEAADIIISIMTHNIDFNGPIFVNNVNY